jgi:hypothetical protein
MEQPPREIDLVSLFYQNVIIRTLRDSDMSWYDNQFDTRAMIRPAAPIEFAEFPRVWSLLHMHSIFLR